MSVKISELQASPATLSGDDAIPILDNGVTRRIAAKDLADYTRERTRSLATGPSVAAFASPLHPERVGKEFLAHDGILWRINAADGQQSSQTILLDLGAIARAGADISSVPVVRSQGDLANDTLLAYNAAPNREAVSPGTLVLGTGGRAWQVIPSNAPYAPHIVNGNGVQFREVGHRFSSLPRFQRALSEGDAYRIGDRVSAGGIDYIRDDSTGGAVEGWSLIPLTGEVLLIAQGSTERLRVDGAGARGTAVQSTVTDPTPNKLLTNGAHGLSEEPPTAGDCNTITHGWRRIDLNTANRPPIGFAGVLCVVSQNEGRVSQIVHDLGGGTSLRIFRRVSHLGGWTDWELMPSRDIDYARRAGTFGAGAIGTLGLFESRDPFARNPGALIAGSQLRWASIGDNGIQENAAPSGTWMQLSYGNRIVLGERVS